MTVDIQFAVQKRLTTIVSETLDEGVDWMLDETREGYQITLADRVLEVEQRDGPAESAHWIITLQADGQTVSKFGPYESTGELEAQLRTVLTSDVFYTVCCDG